MGPVRDCKEYFSKRITDSEVMAKHACELAQLIVLSENGISDAAVYDGVDTNGEYKLRIRAPNSGMRIFQFEPHIYMRNGLYIHFTQKVDSIFVQFRLRPHGED